VDSALEAGKRSIALCKNFARLREAFFEIQDRAVKKARFSMPARAISQLEVNVGSLRRKS
jgi:hypothetical protein